MKECKRNERDGLNDAELIRRGKAMKGEDRKGCCIPVSKQGITRKEKHGDEEEEKWEEKAEEKGEMNIGSNFCQIVLFLCTSNGP